jgi:hypothetical protein
MKILAWIALNGATVLGVVQAVIKLGKEICTGIINILFPLFPDEGKFEKAVIAVRDFFNRADEWVEQIKGVLVRE